MFNILSGLQDGSYSVPTVNRNLATGVAHSDIRRGKCVITDGVGNIKLATTPADAKFVEFVFEDQTGNSSKKYATIFGSFEAETNMVAPGVNFIPGDLLTCGADGLMTKAADPDVAAGNFFGRVTGTKASTATVDHTTGKSLGPVIQFRSK